ncbi:MAG: carbamate kinase [Candidatus Nanohaloarchaea archaeon]|nr:carbamate kinase [Candidatus Nanohaloarchaea archaeon]
MRAVVALGGNALVPKGGSGTVEEQREEVQETARHVARLIEDGHELVLTHGNGPQVGALMLQQDAADTPPMPLDVLVAETQAQIGYLLQQALDNELDTAEDFVTVVTQTVVDPDDPGFDDPAKPVGPYYTAEEAEEKDFVTKDVGEGDRSYRRVVPSPTPVSIVEAGEIREMVDRGAHVVCCGGGGVPVVDDDGLQGVEAVVDKDRASAVLAEDIDADELVILTDVEHAYRDHGGADEEAIGRITADDLAEDVAAGEFGEGSMRPKVEACIRFVRGGGDRAIITAPRRLEAALDGEAGTRVIP